MRGASTYTVGAAVIAEGASQIRHVTSYHFMLQDADKYMCVSGTNTALVLSPALMMSAPQQAETPPSVQR